MRCLITAGPTHEPLDRVRRLTNHSTGRLGTDLANRLAALGHEVVLLRGTMATSPPPVAAVRVVPFGSVAELGRELDALAAAGADAVFHAAAVGDFTFGGVFREEAEGTRTRVESGKVSTRTGRLFAELVPTPKLLPRLRDLFPAAWIVGWKYEVDGTREDALARSREQVAGARTDLCIANGPAYGEGFGWVTAAGHDPLRDAPELYGRIEAELRRRQGR